MSHTTRTTSPIQKELLMPKVPKEVLDELKACQDRQIYYYIRGTKPVQPLSPKKGARVYNNKQWIPVTVKQEATTRHSYIVQTQTGQELKCNRQQFLKTDKPPPKVTVEQEMEKQNDGLLTEQLQSDKQSVPRRSTITRTIPSRFKDFVMH